MSKKLCIIETDPGQRGAQANIPALQAPGRIGDGDVASRPIPLRLALGAAGDVLREAHANVREIVTVRSAGIGPGDRKAFDSQTDLRVRKTAGGAGG